MLGKLMKYDLRAGIRWFGLVWAVLLALGVINGFTLRYILAADVQHWLVRFFLGVMPLLMLFLVFIAAVVVMIIYVIRRFYKGLLCDEGYLMFTLPATAEEHIASKTLTALILEIATILVCCLSGLLLTVIYAHDYVGDFLQLMREVPEYWKTYDMPSGFGWLTAEGILFVILAYITWNLRIYTSLSLGHLANKHRLLWSLLAYFGIGIAVSMLSGSLSAVLFGSSSALFGDLLYGAESVTALFRFAQVWFAALIALFVIEIAVYFFSTRAILKNRLNLE